MIGIYLLPIPVQLDDQLKQKLVRLSRNRQIGKSVFCIPHEAVNEPVYIGFDPAHGDDHSCVITATKEANGSVKFKAVEIKLGAK